MSEETSSSRALPLDALRGLSIFLMILSSSIPFGVLPDWMYHAQVPPPLHTFIPTLPGITWVDLVFPFFLFSMGAAMPFALGRRIGQGVPLWRIILTLLERGLLLAAFAIYDEHIRPWRMHGGFEGIPAWMNLAAILGFLLLLPMFMQMPRSWNRVTRIGFRSIGWIGALVFMAAVRYPDGSGFLMARSDIIILVLANMAFFGGVLWLATRTHLTLRLVILVALIALRVSSGTEGWVKDLWLTSPFPWLFRFDFLKYLFIVIPGTILGDIYVDWVKTRSTGIHDSAWSRTKVLGILFIMSSIVIVSVIGLKARAVLPTMLVVSALLGGAAFLLRNPGDAVEHIVTKFFPWVVAFLLIGFFFEPFEGGIKKDPSTLSYYFITGGLATCTLVVFVLLIERFSARRALSLLIASGQNPLVAYAGINNLIRPLLGLTAASIWLDPIFPTPWLGVIKGILVTSLVSCSAMVFTRWNIYLKT